MARFEAIQFEELITECPDGVTVSFTNNTTYPWSMGALSNGMVYAKSGAAPDGGGGSQLTLEITVPDDGSNYSLSMEYAVSNAGDATFKGYVNDNYTKLFPNATGNYTEGETVETLSFREESTALTAGKNTFAMVYNSNGYHKGLDAAFLKNIKIEKAATLEDIVTYCEDGVNIALENGEYNPWMMVNGAIAQSKIVQGNFSTFKVIVTIPEGTADRYQMTFQYALSAAGEYDEFDVGSYNGGSDYFYEYGGTVADSIEDLNFRACTIPLLEGANEVFFAYTEWCEDENPNCAAYVKNIQVRKLSTTSFSATLPEGVTAVYSVNEGEVQTLTSGASVSVTETDEITITATAPTGYCIRGWYDDAGRLISAANPYTFVANADAAQNCFTAKLIQEGYEGTIAGYTVPENLTVKTYGPYPWALTASDEESVGSQVLASSNQGANSSLSEIAIIPAADGVLSFSYRLSSESSDNLFYLMGERLNEENLNEPTLTFEEYGGITGWKEFALLVKKDVPLYIGYHKDTSLAVGEDTAFLKDLKLNTNPEKIRLTVENRDPSLGNVYVNDTLIEEKQDIITYTGLQCTLKAWVNEVEGEDYFFEGWFLPDEEGRYDASVTDNDGYKVWTFTPTGNMSLQARFNANQFADIAGFDRTDTGLSDAKGRPDYPWTVETMDGSSNVLVSRSQDENGENIETMVSTMYVTAEVDGILMFEYKTHAEDGNGLYYKVGDADTVWTEDAIYTDNVAPDNRDLEAGPDDPWFGKYDGEQEWTRETISVQAGQRICFAFYKGYGEDVADAYLALRNLKIVGGDVTVTAVANNEAYGTVTGNIGKVAAGTTVTLAATPKEGCAFYGWQVNGTTISLDAIYTFAAAEDISLTALFAPQGTYLARIGMTFYPTLEAAFSAAENGESKTVILLEDTAVSEDLTIPAGVTLVVPFSASDETGYQEGTAACARPTIATRAAFRKLTVAAGKTLTVNGTLVVGGVQHAPDQNAQGQTSGDYAEIVCNGTVQVAAGGTLTVYGKITGSGTTRVASGATAKIPYLVTDYAGGTNTEALYNAKSFPFGQYATINVQNTMVVEGGASVIGMTSLYFWSSVYTQEIDLIGTDSGLIYLPVGSTLTAAYDADKAVKQKVGIELQDFGKTTLTISGGAVGGKFDLSGYGSEKMYLNIPYTYDLVLTNGSYSMTNLYRIMPGAVVTVASDAQLNVAGGLQAVDGWQQADKSGKSYPASDVLAANGFSQSGNLIVDGTLNITGTFGGIAQTTGGGYITTSTAAKLNESFTSGSTGGYTDNLVSYSLPARLMMDDTLTQMTAGSEYYAAGSDGWTLESYTMQANRIDTGDTVTINQSMQGKWQGKISVTLTFDTDGGSGIEPITQDYGAKITAPAAPTKTGYTFNGWEPAIPETMPAENMTVKAQWTINQYTITFDTDGGSGIEPITQDYGTKITAPAAPTKTGYTFNGWEPAIPATMPAENRTVKAKWTANQYTITFETDGGSACADITVTFGQTYGTLPTPEKAGYTFAGWYAGETPVTAETMVEITADQTLTAHWNAKGNTPYTVEYYQQNLADNDYTMVKKESLSGQTDSTVEAEIVNYTGFTVNNEKSTTSGTVAGDGGLVLKVYYDRNTYQITWVVDGRETSATYRFGVTPTAPAAEKAADNSGSYTFTGWDKTPAPVTEHARYTAQFRKKYDAVIGETTYRTVALALEAAKTGETVTVQDGAIITESTQVPVGVLLLVPCMADDTGYSQRAGSEYYNPNGTAVEPALGANGTRYCTLTVAEGAALTVRGTLLVNAVTGRPQAGHLDQDINGGYGELQLNGTITVEQGGIFDSCGYTKGNGRITANAGGTVRDLYVVRSWRGGSHAAVMYENKIYPMNEYDMHNITAPIRIYAGAVLEGTVKMYAGGMFSYTRFMQIGESNGLIRLAEGAYADRTYDAKTARVCYTLSGGAAFSSSEMQISGVQVSTRDYYFPVDGDIDLVLEKGAYSINNDLKLLTGSTLTVNGDAALTVEAGANLIAYQQFHDPKNTGDTQYPERPAAKILLKNGAVWTVNGGFAGKLTLDAAEGSRAVVTLAADAATELSSREANGYQKDRTDPCYQEIKECAVMEENTALTAGMQYSFVRRNGKVCAENRFEAVESSGAFRLLASAADGSRVIAAGYDAQGKMTGVSVLVLSAPSMSGTVTLPKGSWTQLRYFLLSPENAPVCEMCSCAR